MLAIRYRVNCPISQVYIWLQMVGKPYQFNVLGHGGQLGTKPKASTTRQMRRIRRIASNNFSPSRF